MKRFKTFRGLKCAFSVVHGFHIVKNSQQSHFFLLNIIILNLESEYFYETKTYQNLPDFLSVVECVRNLAQVHDRNSRTGRAVNIRLKSVNTFRVHL